MVTGIAHVPDAVEALIRLDWSGKALPREALGTGVELVSVDGFSLANLKPYLRHHSWPKNYGPEVTTLLVPTKCEYTVIK